MITLVYEFEPFWGANNRVSADDWPNELPIEDWHEQFIVWLEQQKI